MPDVLSMPTLLKSSHSSIKANYHAVKTQVLLIQFIAGDTVTAWYNQLF